MTPAPIVTSAAIILVIGLLGSQLSECVDPVSAQEASRLDRADLRRRATVESSPGSASDKPLSPAPISRSGSTSTEPSPDGVPAPTTGPVPLDSAATVAGSEALVLARACFVESGPSLTECSAIYHAMRRRAARVNRPWLPVLIAYSAITNDTERVRAIRAWPDGDVPGQSAAWNERWRKLRVHARRLVSGEIGRSPCPLATGWASKTIRGDLERTQRQVDAGKIVRVSCVGVRNQFVREVR